MYLETGKTKIKDKQSFPSFFFKPIQPCGVEAEIESSGPKMKQVEELYNALQQQHDYSLVLSLYPKQTKSSSLIEMRDCLMDTQVRKMALVGVSDSWYSK